MKHSSHMPAAAAPSISLLDPSRLAKLAGLELLATQVMDGFVQGMHRSPHIGFALDFAQHRPYVPGDDIKRIDWRVFAKADRYYIKQYEVSTNLRAHILLDASGSMAYRGKTDSLSKFRYAQCAAACLAYLILHQQDSAGLATFDRAVGQIIPAKSSPAHLLHVVRRLEAARPAGEGAISPLLHELAERLPRRGMVIVISDLFDDADALALALHHLRSRRHEVLLLQTMADDELTFPFRQWGMFEDLEQPALKLRLDPATTRSIYLENLKRHQSTLTAACRKLRISHRVLNTSQPLDGVLSLYLAQRMGRR